MMVATVSSKTEDINQNTQLYLRQMQERMYHLKVLSEVGVLHVLPSESN